MSAWESTRTPSLRKSASCSIIALRNNSESPILSSSATVHSPSVDWSLLKEPHGGRLRQRPLPFTHSRGHYRSVHRISSTLRQYAYTIRDGQRGPCDALIYLLRFLRFLRNDLSVKTSDWWGRWLHQAKVAPARSKSSSKLLSLCSTQQHIRGPSTNPSLFLCRG